MVAGSLHRTDPAAAHRQPGRARAARDPARRGGQERRTGAAGRSTPGLDHERDRVRTPVLGDGPRTVIRTQTERKDLPAADFRFPQDEDHDAVTEVASRSSAKTNWTASFVDYLYFSGSNSMAFSPTDAMPLSHRAKVLMGIESFAGFVILALVIARAVSLLG